MTASAPTAAVPTASVPFGAGGTGPAPPAIPITVEQSACFGLRTAGYVINKALLAILVQGADSEWEPDEYQDALDTFNDYMASLEDQGIRLGYRRVCNVADVVTIPDGAFRGIIANLAIELSSMFAGTVTLSLAKQAKDGMNAIRRVAIKSGQTRYPTTLPYGSGNNSLQGLGYSGAYYNENAFAVLSMSANRRETEINVAAGAEKAQGVWRIGKFSGLEVDVSGRIRNTGRKETLDVDATFKLVAPGAILEALVGLSINAGMSLYTTFTLGTDAITVTLKGTIDLDTGEFLEVVVGNTMTTVNITLIDATVRIG
jgi:hypothetical protein